MKIFECVPNVSEGRNRDVLDALAGTVREVEGVELLDMDPGHDTNRTVFTFVGPAEALAEAALRFARVATARIDMRAHRGAHARFGAVDVCPFVPVGGGATMDDAAELARTVGRRLAEELGLTIYLYEHAATREERRSLAEVRRGEYEGLAAKLEDPDWAPDFGPAAFNEKSGATAVGARPFLIAYNVDLNTDVRKAAHDIALDIREQGRYLRDETGKIVRDAEGNKQRKPGLFDAVRAVGWVIPEFGRAQVSINLTNYHETAPHEVFDAIREGARQRGLRVTGSEIVGLVPLEALVMAGRHYLRAQGRSAAVPEPDLVRAARVSLGLDDVKPFEPEELIIDYRLAARSSGLRAMPLFDFADELSRDTPAPGGGSVAALAGSLGAGLASMVAALSHGSADDAARVEELGARAQGLKDRLMRAVDEDTAAFDGIVAARRMKKKTDEQKAAREVAIEAATRHAIEVPLGVVEAAAEVAELARDVAEVGLAGAASDCGVAAWCARTAAEGAALNVRINLPGLSDEAVAGALGEKLRSGLGRARQAAEEAVARVEARLEA
jgi:glutamate formiminotransferase/formiminotetrahydrofolate cyclodeaminase